MVFPLAAAVAGAVGIGQSLYGASQAKKASAKQLAAQREAEQRRMEAQQRAFDTVQGLNKPYQAAGNQGLDALLQEFGLAPGGARPQAPEGPMSYDAAGNVVRGPAPMAPNYGGAPMGGAGKVPGGSAGGVPEPSLYERTLERARTGAPVALPPGGSPVASGPATGGGYLEQNPDVAQFAEQAVAQGFTPEGWSGGVIDSPEEAAQYHYETYGQQEGRQMPMGPGQQGPIDYTTAERPNAPTAPQFERPDAVQFGDYGQAPNMESFFSNFQADPGYQFRLNEGLRGVNAASAAMGKLRSGDAAKALQARGEGLASQEYGNWFNRQMQKFQQSRGVFEGDRRFAGQRYEFDNNRQDQNFTNDRNVGLDLWKTGVDRGDAVFNADRNYATNRIDNRVNNLFDLTNLGVGANANVSRAAQGFADQQSQSAQNIADARSQNYQNRATANTNMVGQIGNTATNLFANWGGGISGARGGQPQTVGDAWNNSFGGGWQTAANPTFVRRPSDIGRVF